jgi:hypothetical protein
VYFGFASPLSISPGRMCIRSDHSLFISCFRRRGFSSVLECLSAAGGYQWSAWCCASRSAPAYRAASIRIVSATHRQRLYYSASKLVNTFFAASRRASLIRPVGSCWRCNVAKQANGVPSLRASRGERVPEGWMRGALRTRRGCLRPSSGAARHLLPAVRREVTAKRCCQSDTTPRISCDANREVSSFQNGSNSLRHYIKHRWSAKHRYIQRYMRMRR